MPLLPLSAVRRGEGVTCARSGETVAQPYAYEVTDTQDQPDMLEFSSAALGLDAGPVSALTSAASLPWGFGELDFSLCAWFRGGPDFARGGGMVQGESFDVRA